MPRISHLALACGLALSAQAAQAQQFSNVIVIGDSLSDGGNYTTTLGPGFGSFTTNPDPVFVELVAQNYGFNLTPSGITNTGGWNFAWGGAPTGATFGCVPAALTPAGCQNGTTQLANYFARTGGVADPNALYSVFLGANNIFNVLGGALPVLPQPAPVTIANTVGQNIGIISALQAAGANYIVVYNVPNIGATPFGTSLGGAAAAQVTGLVILYNEAFNNALGGLGDGIIPINTFGLINEVIANPGYFGFSNVSGTACGTLSGSVNCFPAGTPGAPFTYAPGANQSFLFADGVHPTGAGHALLAQVVVATIAAPGQVSLAGELPLQVYDDHSGAIRQAIFDNKVGGMEVGESRGFFNAQFGSQDYDAGINAPALSTNSNTFTGGFEYRHSERLSFGAAISLGGSNGDFAGGDIDGQEVLGSLFATANFGNGYFGGALSLGSSSIDINRAIVLGPSVRIEEGNASASHKAFELSGGYLFGDTVRHGPFASATWQRVGIEAFSENGGSATSMRFEEFDRDSLIGRIGYQLQGKFGDDHAIRPSLRVAYASESEDQATRVTAGSNSMNGQFTMDGYLPSDNWIEADLGLMVEFTDKVNGYLGYHGRLSDDNQDNNSYNLGVNVQF